MAPRPYQVAQFSCIRVLKPFQSDGVRLKSEYRKRGVYRNTMSAVRSFEVEMRALREFYLSEKKGRAFRESQGLSRQIHSFGQKPS